MTLNGKLQFIDGILCLVRGPVEFKSLSKFSAERVFLHRLRCEWMSMMKRCRSMSRMKNNFKDRGRDFPCDESQFYEFLCVERENGAPPSRLKGFEDPELWNQVFAGMLFCVCARSRWSDA